MSSVRSPDGSAPQGHRRCGAVAASNPSLKHPAQKTKTPAAVASSLDAIDRSRRSCKIAPSPREGLFWVNKKG
jgi:carbonic anhydrase